MKKALAVILLTATCLMAVACGQANEGNNSVAAPPPVSSLPASSVAEDVSQPSEEELAAIENVQKREEAQQLLAPLYDLFAAEDTDAVMELIATPEYHALGDLLDGPQDNLTYTIDTEPGAETRYLAVYATPVAYEVTDNTTFYYYGQMDNGKRVGDAYWAFCLAEGLRVSEEDIIGFKNDPAPDSSIGMYSFDDDVPNGSFNTTQQFPDGVRVLTNSYQAALRNGESRERWTQENDTKIWLSKFSQGIALPYDDPPEYTEEGYIVLARREDDLSKRAWNHLKTVEALEAEPLMVAPGFHWMYPQD